MSSMKTRSKSDIAANGFTLPLAKNLGSSKHPAYDSLKYGWCIGEAKVQKPELVMAKCISEGCLWSV